MVNIQKIDVNDCFKWCLVGCLHPSDDAPARITSANKDFAKRSDFKDIKVSKNWRHSGNWKTWKNSVSISVFGYENKEIYPIYLSKKHCEDKHVVLLVIGEDGKRHYVLIKDSNTFMYDHTFHL